MTKSKSKTSVKFFTDVAQRHPAYLIGSLDRLAGWSANAVNGYRQSVAADLMLKIVKSGSLQEGAKITLNKGLLGESFDRVLKNEKGSKRDNVVAVNSNLLRFVFY